MEMVENKTSVSRAFKQAGSQMNSKPIDWYLPFIQKQTKQTVSQKSEPRNSRSSHPKYPQIFLKENLIFSDFFLFIWKKAKQHAIEKSFFFQRTQRAGEI